LTPTTLQRASAFFLLFFLPLAYAPITIELRPQKALVAALALPLCVLAAPSTAGAISLGLGLLFLAAKPSAPWELFAVFAAPSVFAALSALIRSDRAFVLRLARRAALVESLVALAGAAGLLPLDTSAFRLPYTVLVGTLGNPNHLASFLLLALPLIAEDLSAPRRADRIEAALAAALSALVVLLSRSHLAALVLAGEASLLVPRRNFRLPLAALALAPIALFWDGFVRALEGRFYLLAVHARGLSLRTLLVGFGPGEVGPRFFDWQAEHLAAHPEDVRFWTYPEHPHDDLLALVLSFGFVTTVLAALVARRHLVLDPALSVGTKRAGLLALALLGLGAGLLVSPVSWAMALLVAAFCLRPRALNVGTATKWKPAATGALLAVVWFGMTIAEFVSAYHHREALRAAAEDHDFPRALQHLDAALFFPFERGKLLHLKGRVLLETNRPLEATLALGEATRHLPHPVVWKTLAAAESASGRPDRAAEARRAWLRLQPGNAAATSRP
jgi:hypothetical protein